MVWTAVISLPAPPPHVGHFNLRASSLYDRASRGGQFVSGNVLNAVGVSSSRRQSLSSNERLPGAVLLVRARLLQRCVCFCKQEALNTLPLEVFGSGEVDVQTKCSRESRECNMCLESFRDKGVLKRLPCGHMFHLACLDPWLRTCGDCPYCRRSVL